MRLPPHQRLYNLHLRDLNCVLSLNQLLNRFHIIFADMLSHKASLEEFEVQEKEAASVQTPSAWNIRKGTSSSVVVFLLQLGSGGRSPANADEELLRSFVIISAEGQKPPYLLRLWSTGLIGIAQMEGNSERSQKDRCVEIQLQEINLQKVWGNLLISICVLFLILI